MLFRKQKKEATYVHAELETEGNVKQSIKCMKVDLLISFYCKFLCTLDPFTIRLTAWIDLVNNRGNIHYI